MTTEEAGNVVTKPSDIDIDAADIFGDDDFKPLLDNPVIADILKRRRPVTRVPLVTARTAVVGGFSIDGKRGQTLRVTRQFQFMFRATEMHATDWVPDMAPIDPGYVDFYMEEFARGPDGQLAVLNDGDVLPELPEPKAFDLVDWGGDSLGLLNLSNVDRRYRGRFYPAPGASTIIRNIYVGALNTQVDGPTSAYARGWTTLEKFPTCPISLVLTMEVEFIRDARFEAALRGMALA